jgi:hypothetical protein
MACTKTIYNYRIAILMLLIIMALIPCKLSAEWGKVILDTESTETESESSSDSESATKTKESHDNEKPLTLPIFINCRANTGDVMPGAGVGLYVFPEYLTSIRVSGFMRIEKKTVFVKKSEHRYYQLKESRYGFDIVADYVWLIVKNNNTIGNFGLYFASGVGFTNGNYAGADIESKTETSPVLKAGFQYGRKWFARCGYQYFKVPDVPSNHVTFECGFTF